MKYMYRMFCLFIICVSTIPCASQKHNVLSDAELKNGWKLLFDGKTMAGWRDYNGSSLTEPWCVVDGCIQANVNKKNGRGFIVTEREYENFELSWDWKLSRGGNSGMLYHVIERPQYKFPYLTGPEYQLIDEENFQGKLGELQKLGVDYDMHAPDRSKMKVNPYGEWNNSRIVFDNGHVEHWLNGQKILEFEAWSLDWYERKSNSKWNKIVEYGMSKRGVICLQDHGSPASFRNIKIRELPRKVKKTISLFGDLGRQKEDTIKCCKWLVKDDLLYYNDKFQGDTSCLLTKDYYIDFELSLDVKYASSNLELFFHAYKNDDTVKGCSIRILNMDSLGLYYTDLLEEKCLCLIPLENIGLRVKKDNWNKLRIKVQNSCMEVWINEQKILNYANDLIRDSKGSIGLVHYGNLTSNILYRNILLDQL